jgi:hypothetical protein
VSLPRGIESFLTRVFLTKIMRGRLHLNAHDHAKLAMNVASQPCQFVSVAIPRLSDPEVFWPWMEESMPLHWTEG